MTRNYSKAVGIIWLCLFLSSNLFAQSLNGTYTIGLDDSDFPTIQSAVDELNTEGISGAVIFNIEPGEYTGSYTIQAFPGNDCNTPVIFQKNPSADDPINFNGAATGVDDNFAFQLSDVNGVTIKGLNFYPGNFYGASFILLSGNASCNEIIDNQFYGSVEAGSSAIYTKGMVPGQSITETKIIGNGLHGFDLPIYFDMPSSGTLIEGNTITTDYIGLAGYEINFEEVNNIIIRANNLQARIRLNGGEMNEIDISGNIFHQGSVDILNAVGSGNSRRIYNNFFTVASPGVDWISTIYWDRIYLEGTNNVGIYFNSLTHNRIEASATISLKDCNSIDLKNNIYFRMEEGPFIITENTTNLSSDYNSYHHLETGSSPFLKSVAFNIFPMRIGKTKGLI